LVTGADNRSKVVIAKFKNRREISGLKKKNGVERQRGQLPNPMMNEQSNR
jgi:hypothetical protein